MVELLVLWFWLAIYELVAFVLIFRGQIWVKKENAPLLFPERIGLTCFSFSLIPHRCRHSLTTKLRRPFEFELEFALLSILLTQIVKNAVRI